MKGGNGDLYDDQGKCSGFMLLLFQLLEAPSLF